MTVEQWKERLVLADSQNRGGVLLAAWGSGDLTDPEMRALINDNWTICEAWGEDLDEALEMLAQFAPVGDLIPKEEDDWLTVYRATASEEPDGGSWTLKREIAEKFALMMGSMRGMFLGMYAEEPWIFEGEVHRSDVLGYFTDREEYEVVVNHGAVGDIRPIAKLVKRDG